MATNDEIRKFLADRHDVEIDNVKTGAEADEEAAGLYHGEEDSWLVYGKGPNTNEIFWFYAGSTQDIKGEIWAEKNA